jgi:predicted alpha/beta hydrolase family esterase
MRRFLVLHGWQNSRPRHHWQWQLVEELRRGGEQVLYPQLPDPDRPSLALWTELLLAELDQLGSEERVVIAHSAGVMLFFSAAPLIAQTRPIDRVLLVAPPSRQVLARHPAIAQFADIQVDARAVHSAAGSVRLVCTDNDPYCPEGADSVFSDVVVDVDLLPGQAHLDPDAGYGYWPSVAAWCGDPSTRLTPRHPDDTAPAWFVQSSGGAGR